MHLPRLSGQLALAFVVGAFAAPPVHAQLPHRDITPAPEVRQLDLVGVSKSVDRTELEASIYTDVTRCRTAVLAFVCRFARFRGFEERHYLNRQELQRDVLRIRVFYYKHGFRETQVDTVVTKLNDKQVAVRFDIQEGPPTIVTALNVSYDSALLSRRQVARLTLIHTGDPLDLYLVDSTRVGFQNELWDQGYADALIDTSTVVDPVTRTANLQFRLVKNHLTTVGDIAISGTDQVATTTVLNSLSFRSGDLYRRSAMLESQRNLYESNLFKLATFEIPPTFDSVKAVNVLLREAPLHEARVGVGFNTVDFIQSDVRFTHYNLFGGARRLDITGAVGNLAAGALDNNKFFHHIREDSSITGDAADFLQPTYQASIDLRQPAFLQRSRNSLSIGAFTQRRAVPAVVIDRGYGGNITYTRTLGLRAPASLTYKFEETRVEAGGPYFCVNFGVCDTTSISALRSHQRLSPVTAQFQVDRSDQPLSPTRGYTARAELETASSYTASDYKYNRAYAEGTFYSRLGSRTNVFAAHMRIGFVRPLGGGGTSIADAVLHPRKRFYAGGSQSVRGYGENQLGPRILTLPVTYLVRAKTITGTPCDVTTNAIRFCDPNTITDTLGNAVGDDKFTSRATGGTSLLEGSVEYRFPLPLLASLTGAVFLDGAAVGERVLDPLGDRAGTLANLVNGTGAITPGFGVRYQSSVGPIRVDVGFNPSRAEDLAVVTEITRNGRTEVIPLDTKKHWSATGNAMGIGSVLNRFTLHLSIGQAY
ncbi:MAG: surface antigen [Gemmatimonadetes bacterium]|nr:surface antigen [Gemmatimonadota bacterium]